MYEDLKEGLGALLSGNNSDSELEMSMIPLVIGIVSFFLLFLLSYIAFNVIKKFFLKNLKRSRKKLFIHKMQKMQCFQIEGNSQLRNLALACWDLGYEIDRHTDRENNLTALSDLVYRISVELGLNDLDCALNFCIAMVYDAGFMDVQDYIFKMEVLNVTERKTVKSHVIRINDCFDFVPPQWQQQFRDAAMFHHENVDGSGYPEGLKGDEIPLTARIIHIAESYVSLTTSRAYHRSHNSKNALNDLKKKSSFYDAEVVLALEKAVHKSNN